MTLVSTNSYGQLTTYISTAARVAATLGVPPGWNGSRSLCAPELLGVLMPCIIFIWTLIYYVLNFASR